MGSNYFGESNFGSERSVNSRRGRKNNNSDKPKHPQRGLGVAQLEKIRLHSQNGYTSCLSLPLQIPNNTQEEIRRQTAYSSSTSFVDSSSSSYGYPGNSSNTMGLGYSDRGNVGYGDCQPAHITRRWSHGYVSQDDQQFPPPIITRQLLEQEAEEKRRRKDKSDSMGSSSHYYESNEDQEIDLELRLSL